jgi:hypothetical protein
LPLCVYGCALRQDLTARASVCLCVYASALLRREAVTLARTLLLCIPSTETGSEKGFVMHAGVALVIFVGRDPEKRDLPHLLLPVVGFISSMSRSPGRA